MKNKDKNNLLWAPWRINYVSGKKHKGCIFCKIYQQKGDEKNYLVLRSKHSFILLNSYPYNNGHVMAITNRHIANYQDLTLEEIVDINKNLNIMIRVYKDILRPQGYNIGANFGKIAGAGVEDHLHFHLVPRWLGDTNFMPVVSDTKVIAQSLEELYAKIKVCLAKINKKI